MISENIADELPKGIICWYEFNKNSKVMLVADKNTQALTEVLIEKGCVVDVVKNITIDINLCKEYDYIVIIDMLERMVNPTEALIILKKCVKKMDIFL